MVAVGRRAEAQEVVVSTLAMAVLELLLAAVFPLQTLLMLVVQAARALERQPEPLAAVAVQALQALRLLLAVCSGKVAVAEAVALLVQVVPVVLEVAALAVVAVVQHAVHMPLAPVV